MADALKRALERIAGFSLSQFMGPHDMALECVNVARAALSHPEPEAVQVPLCVRTAPERIWLQADINGMRADDPFENDGVTWCAESVGGAEVEYVRADLAAPQRPAQAQAQAQAQAELHPDLLGADYAKALTDLSAETEMSVRQVLRCAIRLYQAEHTGLVKMVEAEKRPGIYSPDVQQAQAKPCDMGPICIGCEPRGPRGECPGAQAEARGDEPVRFPLSEDEQRTALKSAQKVDDWMAAGCAEADTPRTSIAVLRELARWVVHESSRPAPAAPQPEGPILSLLLAAGHVTQPQVDQARAIAAKTPGFAPAGEAEIAERERTKTLARWISATMATLESIDPDDMEDGGANLRSLLADGDALVSAVLRGAALPASQPMSREGMSPLTAQQVKALVAEAGYNTGPLQGKADFITGIRHAERAHGIGSGSGEGEGVA